MAKPQRAEEQVGRSERLWRAGEELIQHAGGVRTEMVTALHHVNVTVPAQLEAAAKNFYGVVLGLKQIPKPATSRQSGAWYKIGETQLHLSVEDEARGQLSSGHICFAISDLEGAEQKFRDAGVEIIPDPQPSPNSRRFYVRDPGANLLEIAEHKAHG